MANPGSSTKGVDKRADVVRAALRVFARDGEAGTTTRAVAAEAGLSSAGLRYHFRTREELLTAMLKSFDEPYETSRAPRGVGLAPDELLIAALARTRRHPVQMSLYLAQLASAVDPLHPAKRYFRHRFNRWRTMTADYVRDQQKCGAIPGSVDAEFVAHALLAVGEGLQTQWVADRSLDVDEHVRRAWRALVA